MPESRDFKIGVIWSLICSMIWSTTFVSSRYLMKDAVVDPISLSFLRFAIGGVLLLAYGYFYRRESLFSIKAGDLPILAVLSLFGFVGMSVLLFWGQNTTSAINSSMIMQINPIIICLLGLLIGERLYARQTLGIAISFIGCLMVVNVIGWNGFAYDGSHLTGDVLVAGSATSWAIYTVWGKSINQRLDSFAVTTWSMLIGAAELLVMLPLCPGDRIIPHDLSPWAVIAYIAVFPTAVAFFAWFEAMGKISMALLSIMQYLTPVFTIILAWFLLDERITLINLGGIALVISGVFCLARGKNAAEIKG